MLFAPKEKGQGLLEILAIVLFIIAMALLFYEWVLRWIFPDLPSAVPASWKWG